MGLPTMVFRRNRALLCWWVRLSTAAESCLFLEQTEVCRGALRLAAFCCSYWFLTQALGHLGTGPSPFPM